MTLRFNMLLDEAGLDPGEVRLLRHQTLLPDGRTPLDLWRADRSTFDYYQSYQLHSQRAYFTSPWWACFLGTRDGRTMFAGIYSAGEPTLVEKSFVFETTGETESPGTIDHYALALSDRLQGYAGRLYVGWDGSSSGKRAWKQRADAQDKPITELHLDDAGQPFPGLMEITMPLSLIVEAPPGWIAQLTEARGVYLLTCPRTGELYVGSATGSEGFWGRWTAYAANGHGGNVALISRERSDWTVSILQVAGSADTNDDVLGMEAGWKSKLMTGQFGLTRN